MQKKISLNYPKSTAIGFFQGTQRRVRNSRGKRAIGVRATEILQYILLRFLAYTLLYFFPCYLLCMLQVKYARC